MAKHNKISEKQDKTMSGDSDTYKRPDSDVVAFRTAILDWYDTHARVLPWRARPHEKPNPYHVWLSEIMLQQTVVAAVIPYFQKFVEKWPTVQDLAAADTDEVMANWAGLGYYARARNLLKCAQIVAELHNGVFPDDEKALKALPGIGNYTSAAVRSIAFNKQATVIDGNIERVISRLYAIKTPLPDSKLEIKAKADILSESSKDLRAGDYAQALMDIGAGVCIPQSPRCGVCPLSRYCQGRVQRVAAELPYKKKKAVKPQRYGHIYLITNENNDILLHKRPEKGLLGGMLGFPTSEWIDDHSGLAHIDIAANPIPMGKNVEINHAFTHFNLKLKGVRANLHEKITNSSEDYIWIHIDDIVDIGLPTVFKKFAKLIVRNHVKSR